MEVTPSRLRAAAQALHELSAAVRTALSAGDRAGPGSPAWATDVALSVQVAAWDGYLTGLADRLGRAGDGLASAADGYASTDRAVGRRLW
jgi:hypothetical protein